MELGGKATGRGWKIKVRPGDRVSVVYDRHDGQEAEIIGAVTMVSPAAHEGQSFIANSVLRIGNGVCAADQVPTIYYFTNGKPNLVSR
jgi:multidrug resistance efflux pump